MKLKIILLLVLSIIETYQIFAQAPGCPYVNAGPDVTLNCNGCTTLTAAALATGATTSYSVSSIAYSGLPYPYSSGTAIMVGSDDVWSSTITLPFNFCFFGNTFNKIIVGANGLISFDIADAGAYCAWSYSASLPSSSLQTNCIMGPYHDIDPSVSGNIRQAVLGTYPCRTFVVNYDQVAMYSCTSVKATHQIVMYEGTNVIEVYIQNAPGCSSWNSGNKCIGIQNAAGTVAYTPPGRNTGAWTTTNEAWRFTPTGTPNYTLAWFQGATQIATGPTVNVCPLSTTTYTAKVTYTNCDGSVYTDLDDVVVNVTNNVTVSVNPATSNICAGQSVTLTASGSSASYVWSNGATTSSITVTPSATTTYTVTATSGVCSNTATATINVTPMSSANAGADQGICLGASATLTASGGTSYSWSTGATTASITVSPVATTSYYVTVSNGSCGGVDTIIVSVVPSVDAGASQNVCGLTTTLSATQPPGSYSFSWSSTVPGVSFTNPTSPSSQVTVPSAGSYLFAWTITNPDGTTCFDQVSIKFSSPPVATFDFTPILCFDNNTSTINFTGTSEVTAIFHWDYDGGTLSGNDVTWTTAGDHYVTLYIEDGPCTTPVTTHVINTPPDLITSVTTVPVSCASGTNGTVVINVSGGVSGYVYNYSNCNCSTPPTAANNYTVTITDANGCQEIDNFTIDQPDPLTVTQVHTNLDCFEDASGTAGVTASGGTPGYIYSWSNNLSLNNPNQSGLQAGDYTVSVSDVNGCETSITISLTQPPQLNLTVNGIQDITCNGLCNGNATASATGGTSPLVYNWGTSSSPTITTLCQGSHTVTVTDANNCSTTSTITINEPTPLGLTITNFTDVNCFNGTDGTATAAASGGTSPYIYHWFSGSANTSVSGLAAGTFGITVTDDNGCINNTTVTISEPTLLVADIIDSTHVTCYGLCNGTAQGNVSGGTPPYTWFWWSGPQGNQASVNILCAGLHTATVTDAHNCTTTTSVVINQPTELIGMISNYTTGVLCYGSNDGYATADAIGGSPGYLYEWDDPLSQTSATASNLGAGTYTVSITDANGCDTTVNVTIIEPTALNATANLLSDYNGYAVSCFGSEDASVDLLVSGGTVPYSYSWSNGYVSQDLVSVPADNYFVTISDANGCQIFTSINLNEPDTLISIVSATSDFNGYGIRCYGTATGYINTAISGGVTPYNIVWSNNDTSLSIQNLTAGTYTLSLTDANGCITTLDTTLSEPDQLTGTTTGTNILCFGSNTGSAIINASGGIGPYLYLWNNTYTTADISSVAAGLYFVSVTDANNCLFVDSIQITQPTDINISTTPNQLICSGVPTTLSAVASGGAGSFVYFWSTGVTASSIIVSPTLNTTYNVYAVDANGCYSDTNYIIINVLPPLSLTLYADRDSICEGSFANINALTSGGTGGPYFLFDHNNTFVNTLPYQAFPSQTTQYIFTARDDCGTSTKDTITIYVLPRPQVVFTADKRRGCKPLTVSFIEQLNDPGSTYEWNFEENNASSQAHYPVHTFNSDGNFSITLTVVSADGCENNKTIEDFITVYPLPDPRFSTDPEYASILTPNVLFTNHTVGAADYVWSFGDGDSSNIENPIHLYKALGTYNVDLIAITNRGCKDTVSAKVIIHDEYSFYAPTAFSPDHNTLNDVFNVVGHGMDPTKFKMTIYDRWGQLMYETRDLLKGWDGKHMNGGACPNGTYTWMVVYSDFSNVVHHKSGPVTLIR